MRSQKNTDFDKICKIRGRVRISFITFACRPALCAIPHTSRPPVAKSWVRSHFFHHICVQACALRNSTHFATSGRSVVGAFAFLSSHLRAGLRFAQFHALRDLRSLSRGRVRISPTFASILASSAHAHFACTQKGYAFA